MTYHVYTLADPAEPDAVRYVGASTSPKQRLFSHLSEARKKYTGTHKQNWIRSVLFVGRVPVLTVVMTASSEDEVFSLEQQCIQQYRDEGHPLTNANAGGLGGVRPTPEVRARNSAARRREWSDPAIRAKHCAAMQSPTTRAKKSIALTRYYTDPAARAKTRTAMRRLADPAYWAARIAHLEQQLAEVTR